MALPSGPKLEPYEIAAPLGAGGMGEVYRARNTRFQADTPTQFFLGMPHDVSAERRLFLLHAAGDETPDLVVNWTADLQP